MTAKKRRRSVWLLVVPVVIVAAVVLVLLALSRGGDQEDWRQTYRSVAVEAVSFQESVEISGNFEPLRARDLAFPVAGKVVEIPVAQGQILARAALLARLDDRAARYELAAVELSLEQKRLAGAVREVRLLELERDLKAQAVEDRELRAPFAGRLSLLEIQAGDYVAAGRRVARVVDISSLKARVQIDELDAPSVRIGQPVHFFIDALPDLQIAGRVSALSMEGRITSDGLTVVDGEVVIDRPPTQLVVGYSFSGEILVGREETVLVLPESALVKQAGQVYVYLRPEGGGSPELRAVGARVLDTERVEVLSGLSEGEQVLVPLAGPAGREPNARLSTRGLLKSLQRRARVPILGGGSSANSSSRQQGAP